ncbi:hypothetical protein ACFLZV_07475 [Candidatus Margulisiibacteriota bacterium]
MRIHHNNTDISSLEAYFDYDCDKQYFKKLINSFPLAFKHILNELRRNKKLSHKSVKLPNGDGVLQFSKEKDRIKVHLEKRSQRKIPKTFSGAIEQVIEEVRNEKRQKSLKKQKKSLVQKSFQKTVIDKVYTLLQEDTIE